MNCTDKTPVIAFTESHVPYQGLDINSELNIKFCSDLDIFFEEIISQNFFGIILEMRKVMDTPAFDRNKIFTLAKNKPLLRSKTKNRTAILVDDPVQFQNDCRQKHKGQVRRFKRVNTDLQIQISTEEDYVMANDFYGKVINISEEGCFFRSKIDFSGNQFAHIKFNDIPNKLPIYCAIRRTSPQKDGLFGYGVQFVSIHEDQSEVLFQRYIEPNLISP